MTKECRAVMQFLFLKGKTAKEIYDMSITLGEKSPSYLTVKNWVARCKTEHFSTEGKDCPRKATLVTVPENVDAIHSMIVADWRISARKIAETLEIDSGTCRIHHALDKRKLFSKWVPKCLSADQKRDCVVAPKAFLEHSRWNTVGFLAQLVTMNKTWIHLYDPETKE